MAMHSYEADGRTRVTLALAIVGWLLSALLRWPLSALLDSVDAELSWWISAPSWLGCFSAAYWAFDRYVWRLDLLRKIGFVNVPNLNGEWKGEIKSSHGDGSPQLVSVVICQRWSKMAIRLATEHSRSHSTLAAIKTDDAVNPEITYLYLNEPNQDAQKTMEAHRGTAILELSGEALVGSYYSGRGRQEMGTITLKRAR